MLYYYILIYVSKCGLFASGIGQIMVLPSDLQVFDVLSVDNVPEPFNEVCGVLWTAFYIYTPQYFNTLIYI